MPDVTWADDSKPIRLFQIGVRLSAHFYDAMAKTASAKTDRSPSHVDELNKRWLMLSGDQTIPEYEERLQKELFPLAGEAVFDHIRVELAKPFHYDQKLVQINQAALDAARRCIKSWGGAKAQRRLKQLKLLPLHLESIDDKHTQFSFERTANRILVRPGLPEILLRECMILEFSLFHEYLSHAFPAWSKDVEPISEGWLFALEFEWFESQYTPDDIDLLTKVWHRRLEQERRSFWAGRWLLKRCKSRECVAKFLLEWVAGWDAIKEDVNLDLLSQLLGMRAKAGHGLGGKASAKQLKILEMLDKVLCEPCQKGSWDVAKMRDQLESVLRLYGGR
jgi:hypothetical protein